MNEHTQVLLQRTIHFKITTRKKHKKHIKTLTLIEKNKKQKKENKSLFNYRIKEHGSQLFFSPPKMTNTKNPQIKCSFHKRNQTMNELELMLHDLFIIKIT